MLENFGKLLIFFGFLLIFFGVVLIFGSKIPYFGKLPGDIYIKKENFTFYFPLTSCLVLSILLSFIFYLFARFFK